MSLLIGFLYFALDVVAAILLVATWQNTRIKGFLWVAGSVVLGIVLRLLSPFLFRFSDGTDFELVNAVAQGVYIAVTAVALFGFWDIYRGLKARSAAPHTA